MLSDEIKTKLLANGQATITALENGRDVPDHVPVVKLYAKDGRWKWLLTEMLNNEHTLYGLCDLGLGFPEVGYVSMEELTSVRDIAGNCVVQVDEDAQLTEPLSHYHTTARRNGRIMV